MSHSSRRFRPTPPARGTVQQIEARATDSPVSSPAPEEAAHISYLLEHLQRWREQGMVCDHCGDLLERQYTARKMSLLTDAESSRSAVVPVSPDQSIVATAFPQPILNEGPAAEARAPGIAGFLEAHSMKLLGLLAALFIFVGMRHILAWRWSGGFAVALVPLLPLGLTMVFHHFGMRHQAEKAYGGLAYCAVAIVLSAFTVYPINEYWFNRALSSSAVLLLGLAVSTAMAGWTLHKTREPIFIHVTLFGFSAAVIAALQIAAPSSWLLPHPVWLYSSALLVSGFAVVLGTRKLASSSENPDYEVERRKASLLWPQVWTGFALFWTIGGLATGTADAFQASCVFTLATGLLGIIAESSLGSAGAALAAVVALGASGLLVTAARGFDWYSVSLASFITAAAALASTWLYQSRPVVSPESRSQEIGAAYALAARVLGAAAGMALMGRLFFAISGAAPPITGSDWLLGVFLGFACAAHYSQQAVSLRKAEILYAAIGTGTYSIALLADRLLPASPLFTPRTLALNLFPAAAVWVTLAAISTSVKTGYSLSRVERAWSPFLNSAAVLCVLGLMVAAGHGVFSGQSMAFWLTLGLYGILAAGSLALTHRRDLGRQLSFWAGYLAAVTVLSGAFAGAYTAQSGILTPALAAGLAMVLTGWVWFAVTESMTRSRPSLLRAFRAAAGASAVLGALLAVPAINEAAVWMSAAFTAALALLVAIGVRSNDLRPVILSFAIVVLGPLRLSAGSFGDADAAGHGVLAAVLFALESAVIYGWATWRMGKPDLVWFAAASVAVAGGGGILFGSRESDIARTIAEWSGFGMAAGALALGITAAWGRRPLLVYAAGLMEVAAYLRLTTLFVHFPREWIGAILLPALAVLVVASHVRNTGDEALFHKPLQRIALAAGYLVLPYAAALAFADGPPAYFAMVVTFFSYALIFGISAQAGAELDHPLGVLSTAALLAGWFFGLQVSTHDPHSWVANLLLVSTTAVCATLYARVAWKLNQQAPAYGAAIAACCAYLALLARVARIPFEYWSLLGLPFMIALYVVGSSALRGRALALSMPFRRIACGAVYPAILGTISVGVWHGPQSTVEVTVATLLAYGAALTTGAIINKSALWSAGAGVCFVLAYGCLLAAMTPAAAVWALQFALSGLAAITLAYLFKRKSLPPFATAMARTADGIAAVAGSIAILKSADPHQAGAGVSALIIVLGIQLGNYVVGRRREHLHVAFLAFLAGYWILLRHFAGLGLAFADVYLLPAGVYLLLLGDLAAASTRRSAAAMLRWLGLVGLLAPTIWAFYGSYSHAAMPLHAFLLLIECIGVIAWGIAERIRAFIQAGTLCALAFVALCSFSVVEIWTGLFSVTLGILLLAAVFYLSVHQKEVRTWITRLSQSWSHWH